MDQPITPAFWFGEFHADDTYHVYARYGRERGWVDGESREVARPHAVRLGRWGYHGATTWAAAMQSGCHLEVAPSHAKYSCARCSGAAMYSPATGNGSSTTQTRGER